MLFLVQRITGRTGNAEKKGRIFMSDFKPIETQEELDRIIGERLARQKEKFSDYGQLKQRVEDLEKENGALKSAVESNKSNAQEHDQKVADLESKLKSYESKEMRLRVAVSNGLPIELADRLIGDDEESIVKDAERLSSLMAPPEPKAPIKSIEPSLDGSGNAGIKQMLEDLRGE